MASEADGSPGNRPASKQEIDKLRRNVCERCSLAMTPPVVVGDREHGFYCTNAVACRKRAKKLGRAWALLIEDL